jgi:hypothetical protein
MAAVRERMSTKKLHGQERIMKKTPGAAPPFQKGFSIVELLVGSAIFLAAFLLVMGILPSAFQSLLVSKNYMLATQIAGEKLEELSTVTFDTIITNYNNHSDTIRITNRANGVTQDLVFQCDYKAVPVYTQYSLSYDLIDVTVDVHWEQSGLQCHVIMSTRVMNI